MEEQLGRPVAFEVLHNGRRVCLAGLRGRPGVLTVILHWAFRTDEEELLLDVGGLDSYKGEHATWAKRALNVGDEITIRAVESQRPSKAKHRMTVTRAGEAKQELAYLRRAAAKHGYELVKWPPGRGSQ